MQNWFDACRAFFDTITGFLNKAQTKETKKNRYPCVVRFFFFWIYCSTGTHRGSVFSLLSCGSSTLNSPSGTAVCESCPSFLLVVNP